MKRKIVVIGIIFFIIFQMSSCASLGFKPLPPGQMKKITGEKNASGK